MSQKCFWTAERGRDPRNVDPIHVRRRGLAAPIEIKRQQTSESTHLTHGKRMLWM